MGAEKPIEKLNGTLEALADELWICLNCAQQYGLRHPYPENLDSIMRQCSFCLITGLLVVRHDDLFPPNEEIPFD